MSGLSGPLPAPGVGSPGDGIEFSTVLEQGAGVAEFESQHRDEFSLQQKKERGPTGVPAPPQWNTTCYCQPVGSPWP